MSTNETEQTPERKSAARNTLGIFTTSAFCLPITLLASLWVTRELGPARQGVLSFLLLLNSFILPIMMFGIGNSVVYFISSKQFQAKDTMVTSLLLGTLHGLAVATIFGLLWYLGLLGAIAAEVPVVLGILTLLLVPMHAFNLMATRFLLGDSQFSLSNKLTLTAALTQAALSCTLVCVFKLELNGAVASLFITNSLQTFIVCWLLWHKYQPCMSFDYAYAKRAYGYGIKTWIGNLASRANLRIDQAILGGIGSSQDLGLYSVAIRLSEMIWLLPDALGKVLFNRIAATSPDDQRLALTGQVHRSLFLLITPIAILFGIAAWWLIPVLLGERFRESTHLLAILLPGTVAFISFKITTKYLGASGSPELTSLIQSVSLVFGLFSYTLLTYLFGMRGTAVACTLTYVFTSAFATLVMHRKRPDSKLRYFAFCRDDLKWLYLQANRAFSRT